MKQRATVFLVLLSLCSPALASGPGFLINGGTMDFDYLQVPPGSINGHFGSSGSLVDVPATEGTAATTFVLNGVNYLAVVGATENGTNFVDGGVVIVGDLAPITTGTYSLDGVTSFFVFVDDAVGWVPPADLWNTNWTLELASIVAAGKHVSVSGSVTLTSVNSLLVAGTFTATTFDADTGVTLAVTSGTFNVDSTTGTESTSWSSVKALYR